MTASTILDERINVLEFSDIESRPTTTPCGWEVVGEENCQSSPKGRPQLYQTLVYDEKGLPPELGAINRRHSLSATAVLKEEKCADNAPDCLVVCKPDQLESDKKFSALTEDENSGHFRHVRYEIGEHPLADIISLSGGGDLAARVTVGTLVPGGKAAEAGVVVGDELVGVSGRPDFQRIPADRLLETLPTPILLVFAKDANAMSNVELNNRLEKAMSLAEHEARQLAEAISSSDGFESTLLSPSQQLLLENAGLQLEASTTAPTSKKMSLAEFHDWINTDNISKGESRESPRSGGGDGKDGFAGTSWDIGDRREPTCGDENNVVQTQLPQNSPAPTRGVDNYSAMARHANTPAKIVLPSKDDAMVGVPHFKTVFDPGVQVELFDQVVFHPGASLMIEGSQHLCPGRESSESGEPISKDPTQDGLAWMYELRRVEARRLVEFARRTALPAASRFEISPEAAYTYCEAVSSTAKPKIVESIHSSTAAASSVGDHILQERADSVARGDTLFEARGDTMATDFTSRGDTLMSVDVGDLGRSDTIVNVDTGNPVPYDWMPGPQPKKPDKQRRSGPRLGSSITGLRNPLQRVEPPDDWQDGEEPLRFGMPSPEDEETLRFGQVIPSFTEL